jgi:hypothetical protein
MAQPAEKRRRTIDPERVVTIDDWLSHYKNKYTNVRLDDGGYYSVYDTSDSKKLVKRIPLKKGVDAFQILASTGASELRADAHAKYDSLLAQKKANIETASPEYVAKESELVAHTTLWNKSSDTAQRVTLARQIGVLTKELEQYDSTLQNATYSSRKIYFDEDMTYATIDYRTHNPKKLGFTVYYSAPKHTVISERIVSIPTEAETA